MIPCSTRPMGLAAALAAALATRLILWLFAEDEASRQQRAQARYRRWQESPYRRLPADSTCAKGKGRPQ